MVNLDRKDSTRVFHSTRDTDLIRTSNDCHWCLLVCDTSLDNHVIGISNGCEPTEHRIKYENLEDTKGKLRSRWLVWFGHVQGRDGTGNIRAVAEMNIEWGPPGGRPRWKDTVRSNTNAWQIGMDWPLAGEWKGLCKIRYAAQERSGEMWDNEKCSYYATFGKEFWPYNCITTRQHKIIWSSQSRRTFWIDNRIWEATESFTKTVVVERKKLERNWDQTITDLLCNIN